MRFEAWIALVKKDGLQAVRASVIQPAKDDNANAK